MPDRPSAPSVTNVLNEHAARLRAVERIAFPPSTITTSAGGTVTGAIISEWDAVVDSSLIKSDPVNRQFKGIYEALNYLGVTLGLTRAWVLIELGDGTTYTEAAGLSAGTLRDVYLYGHDYEPGGSVPRIAWNPKGDFFANSTTSTIGVENLLVAFNQDTSLFANTSDLITRNAIFEMQGSSSSITVGGNVYAFDTSFISNKTNGTLTIGGGVLMVALYGCELHGLAPSSIIQVGNGGMPAAWVDVSVLGSSGATASINFATAKAFVRTAPTNLTRVGGGGVVLININVTVDFFGDFSSASNVNINTTGYVCLRANCSTLTVAAACILDFTGFFDHLVVSSAGARGTIRGSFSRYLDFQGSHWVVDMARNNPTSGTANPALKVRSGVTDSVFRIAASQGGTEQAYVFDAGANRNILDFAGQSTFTTASTDAGTANLIRVT